MNLFKKHKYASFVALAVIVLFSFFFYFGNKGSLELASTSPAPVGADYFTQVQPIFESRCVACHGCYSAPCQFNLQSPEGLARGMHIKPEIYDPARLSVVPVTRLESDGHLTEVINKDGSYAKFDENLNVPAAISQSIDWKVGNWRVKGFDPVINHNNETSTVLLTMLGYDEQDQLDQSRANPSEADLMSLPRFDTMDGSTKICASTGAEVNAYYFHKYPAGRMPYGLPALSGDQLSTLHDWVSQKGGPYIPQNGQNLMQGPNNPVLKVSSQISDWQNFFNGQDLRSKLVARYIYEHYFLAHLWFKETPDFYFRMIRSATNCSDPSTGASEIVTRRPNDDPGVAVDKVFYCLVPLNQVLVEKNHMPVLLSPEKLARVRSLFFDPKNGGVVSSLPGYDLKTSANPFVTFDAIPAFARHQFLLDEAQYEVSTFIKGPVCYGNGAINVIQEQFYVYFLRPESDPMSRPNGPTNTKFYEEQKNNLILPGSFASEKYGRTPGSKWGILLKGTDLGLSGSKNLITFLNRESAFETARMAALSAMHPQGLSVEDFWDGRDYGMNSGPVNDNAFLTGFRNSESAFVVKGAQGGVSKTTWTFDYSLFERTIYDLVVNFDVFDDIRTQALTRAYMGLIREDAENMFLNFLPTPVRLNLHKSWYVNNTIEEYAREKATKVDYSKMADTQPRDNYFNGEARTNGRRAVEALIKAAANGPMRDLFSTHVDKINWDMSLFPSSIVGQSNSSANESVDDVQSQAILHQLTARPSRFSLAFPDTAYLIVKNSNDLSDIKVYVINRNKEIKTPVMISKPVLDVGANSLTITKDFSGSFPNLFFVVSQNDLNRWVGQVMTLTADPASESNDAAAQTEWNKLIALGGIQKADPAFWSYYDAVQAYFNQRAIAERSREAGIQISPDTKILGVIDLSRYGFASSIEVH